MEEEAPPRATKKRVGHHRQATSEYHRKYQKVYRARRAEAGCVYNPVFGWARACGLQPELLERHRKAVRECKRTPVVDGPAGGPISAFTQASDKMSGVITKPTLDNNQDDEATT